MKKDYTEVPFKLVSLYKMVRHPMMLGFILGFWAIPVMTQGHLLFAIAMTLYILIGIYLEERNLVDHLGSEYAQYRTTTSMLIPSVKK
jgi:protein-S-isoprenylcysteine O-methyltransferase Ste14